MHTFQINVVITFLVFSTRTCFERHEFIIRKTVCTCSFELCVFQAKITIKDFIRYKK
jgi:hypothetical protein